MESRDSISPSRAEHSKRRNTLAVRLSQEHPKVFKAYPEGHYKSIRAAAEAGAKFQTSGGLHLRPSATRTPRVIRAGLCG